MNIQNYSQLVNLSIVYYDLSLLPIYQHTIVNVSEFNMLSSLDSFSNKIIEFAIRKTNNKKDKYNKNYETNKNNYLFDLNN